MWNNQKEENKNSRFMKPAWWSADRQSIDWKCFFGSFKVVPNTDAESVGKYPYALIQLKPNNAFEHVCKLMLFKSEKGLRTISGVSWGEKLKFIEVAKEKRKSDKSPHFYVVMEDFVPKQQDAPYQKPAWEEVSTVTVPLNPPPPRPVVQTQESWDDIPF